MDRLRSHERCPGLLKELLRGSLGDLRDTQEVSELLREVLGGPWETLGALWRFWTVSGGSREELWEVPWSRLRAHKDGLPLVRAVQGARW